MCGITGIINNKLADPLTKISNAIVKLKERGPDNSGIWKSEKNNIYLGHTRLYSRYKRFWITTNAI